ncbi:formate dehydrogenase accessory protein FdhE [Pseudodesulfovibrio sediminis]|uniref:Formate dehydrogenase formation protein FdhE n=1 Tax=Pseudodesulfovibrio sediminis TaxID=2810563 RepID=A0ABM7P2Z9_9BACT|nr:formate dehydrogenase accessory protein FdhE [Pseudodesulfovibrio sediminis]BCS87159.1 formate dehydrogenase formation protein FdhE [Pseudodesulfovibrio sediminis]
MKSSFTQGQIESTLQDIQARDTAYAELAGRFGALFLERESVRTNLIKEKKESLQIDAGRVAVGVPILSDVDLTPWSDLFSRSNQAMLPVFAEVLQLEEETFRKLQSHLKETDTLMELVHAKIAGNRQLFEQHSEQLDISPHTLLSYCIETVCSPAFSAIAHTIDESFSWDQGSCPVCGSTPSIAQLSPKEVDSNEYLVGGGGKKYLHCTLCGHDWHYKRNACAACGNEDNESREIFHQDDVKYERIEACHNCGKYMLCVDMREYASLPDLDTVQMGLIHLDVIAHERQLYPITQTLWNTLK